MKHRLMSIMLCCGVSLVAQQPVTFQYFYDDNGQLAKAVDSTGIVIEYVYDAVGNMLQVKRSTVAPGSLVIFSFTPQSAGPLTQVTIQGQGFSTTPSLNIVKFGGVTATVISATSTTLVVQVPVGALTGSLSVTVGANTANSTTNFTALPIPVITSVSPSSAAAGSSIPSFQVTGANLTGATFSFAPTLSPTAITIGSVSINPTGTSATLGLTISGSAAGQFALVATNAAGASTGFPTASNTLAVGTPTQFVSQLFSMLNSASPAPTTPTAMEADGLLISILNSISPGPTGPTLQQVNSLLFSILNGASPAPTTPTLQEKDSFLFSVLNSPSSMSMVSARVKEMLTSVLAGQMVPTPGSTYDLSVYGADSDGDGIPDLLELLIGTNPYNADSDGDGFPDGLELALGSDPLDPLSKPNLAAPPVLGGTSVSVRNQMPESGQRGRPNQ